MPPSDSQAFLRERQSSHVVPSSGGASQESNPTTWRLAATPQRGVAIRGIDFNFGKEPANSFTQDPHPGLRADYVMALPSAAARSHLRSHPGDRPNGKIDPPFNIKDWRASDELVHDARWNGYDTPPTGNANYAWILRMVSKLSENGVAGFVLVNGSMSPTPPAKAR